VDALSPRERGAVDDLARKLRAPCQIVDIRGIEPVENLVQARLGVGLVEHVPVRRGGDG